MWCFFGCNYNDKKIKSQFDSLKKRIEGDTALRCIVVDKRSKNPARDLWKDIKAYIEEAAACIFDVTEFLPNVVLELGYALSIKDEGQIFITFRKRKSKGRVLTWLLSDIAHLNRHEYVNVPALEEFVREQLDRIFFSKKFVSSIKDCETTNAVDKYKQYGTKIFKLIRDEGQKSEQQLRDILTRSACRANRMLSLLKKNGLIYRRKGLYSKYTIPDLPP